MEWEWLEEYFRQEAHDERLESGEPDPAEFERLAGRRGEEVGRRNDLESDSYDALRARLTGAR